MATVFTQILNGQLPGRFVYADDDCAAFLTIAPVNPGHTLVVPRAEIDSWLDLPPDLAGHLMRVAHRVGQGVHAAAGRRRVGLVIAGLEVPHTHLHLIPFDSEAELHFDRADTSPDPAALDDAAARIREGLGNDAASGPATGPSSGPASGPVSGPASGPAPASR